MKIRKVVASAGNRPTPVMEMEEGNVESETKAKTASLPDEQTLSSSNYRRLEEVAREATWWWTRESMLGQHAKIRLRYQKTVFDDIRSVLTAVGGKKLVQQFRDGCFGHLMHFIGGQQSSCTKALHELISREIRLSSAQEDELWFHIGGTNIRFSPQEYALITGLRFGSSSFDPLGSHEMPKGGVCKRFFKGRPITVKELRKKFNSQRMGESPENYLKVAHILALYLMVLGYGQPKAVDQWVWVLAEDLDSWNRFPWGAYTYQALMHYVKCLPKSRAGLGQMYYFCGPAWALQIWGYEAIPDLGNMCALITGKVTMPRCLKWSFRSKKINLVPLFKEELECFVTLEPTDEEKLQPYWVSLQTSQPLGVLYTPPRGTRSRGQLASDKSVTSQQHCSSSAERADPFQDSDSDDSTWSPSTSPKRTRASTRLNLSSEDRNDRHGVPQLFDEARFVDRVSDTVVNRLIDPIAERLSQLLIPQIKQLVESRQYPPKHSPPQLPRNQLEMMHETSFLHAKPPGNNAESAKAAERKQDVQFHDGCSSSMNFSRMKDKRNSLREKKKPARKDAFGGEEQLEVLNNATRLDNVVSGGAKSSRDQKGAVDQVQIVLNERSKGELKRKPETSPHREGDEAKIAKKNNNKKKKMSRVSKQRRWSPSSSSSEDEGSESSSGNERRRKLKKRSKKKKRKYSESSSSESSPDSDSRRKKRKRHRRRLSSSSDASDSVSFSMK